jgi:guanosine-3',5'-bis(diphosphate) 3'-pyrophosphohydrolase
MVRGDGGQYRRPSLLGTAGAGGLRWWVALQQSRAKRETRVPKTTDGLGLVLRAAQFAAHKHRDKRRKDVKATPYINHPINLAEVLHTDGGVHDPIVIAAALLHDTIEDTETTYDELRGVFGTSVADVVIEVTDVKFLADQSRKRLQVAKAGRASERARQVKLADKICNLRDILASPPAGWSLGRRQKYFDWAKEVVDQARGVNPRLERMFDRLYRQKPTG